MIFDGLAHLLYLLLREGDTSRFAFQLERPAPRLRCLKRHAALAHRADGGETLRKVQAWWLLRSPDSAIGSASSAAYTKARQRLDTQAIDGVGCHLVDRMERRARGSQKWLGRDVKVSDGTTLSMPDTPENQEIYPQPSTQKSGRGFPQMRLIGVFSLATGAMLDYAKSSIHVSECILFGQLIPKFDKGDIALKDRGFGSYHAFSNMTDAGVDAIIRLNGARKVDLEKGKKIGHND